MNDPLDKIPQGNVELAQLRAQIRISLVAFRSDVHLRRALMHAESAIADRLGERRNGQEPGSAANRITRRKIE